MKTPLLKILSKLGIERDNFLQAKFFLLSFLLLNIRTFKVIPFTLSMH